MFWRKITILIFVFGLIIVYLNSESLKDHEQEYLQRPDTFFWINFGIGIGIDAEGDDGVLHMNQSFTIQQGKFNLTLRKYGFAQIMDEYSASEIALMFGLNKKNRCSILVFGLGPGKVFPDRSSLESVIGLAFEGQIIWSFSKLFGIGGYVFGNINKFSLVTGFCFSLQIGRLR